MTNDACFKRCEDILGREAVQAMARARDFLRSHSRDELLAKVGQTLPELALNADAPGKGTFPVSYADGKPAEEDLLAGDGVFYVTQSGRVMLDCIGGHYQMTWGYGHPSLRAAAREAEELGIVWDNHSNTPSIPVKQLAKELTDLGAEAGLDRVYLGLCTGSVACSTALKIMLGRYIADKERMALGPPAVIALAGNYHGTDMVAQMLRGMWPELLANMEPVTVEPNDPDALRAAFEKYGCRVAGFWAEPVMMNREAILVETDYLRLARELCTEHDAVMVFDEIQTGFWTPRVFRFLEIGVAPDMVVIGKGMTAGFHPLSGLLYRSDDDILAQYDAISTNGNASLAAFVALCNLRLISADRERIATLARSHYDGVCGLAGEFSDLIQEVNGAGLLTGIKFRTREDALGFHKAAVARGLWVRAHAYYKGHRTILTKHALVADEAVVAHVLGLMGELLGEALADLT